MHNNNYHHNNTNNNTNNNCKPSYNKIHSSQGVAFIIAGLLLLGYTFDLINTTTILVAMGLYLILRGVLMLQECTLNKR